MCSDLYFLQNCLIVQVSQFGFLAIQVFLPCHTKRWLISFKYSLGNIFNKSCSIFVYRKTALGGRELAEVETGITNGVDIEILSGLGEGDTIYLASKVSSEAEVKSTEETAEMPAGAPSDTRNRQCKVLRDTQ